MDPVPPITAPWAQPLGPTPCSKDLALPARARPPELAGDWRRGRGEACVLPWPWSSGSWVWGLGCQEADLPREGATRGKRRAIYKEMVL